MRVYGTEAAKWLAIVAMLVEHTGRAMVPGALGPVLCGRIAFPMFALLIGYNLMYRTRDVGRFAERLLVWGVAAQLPWLLAFGHGGVNVLFTLAFGLVLGCWLCQDARRFVPAVVLVAFMYLLEANTGVQVVEYGWAGVGVVACACAGFGNVRDAWPCFFAFLTLAQLPTFGAWDSWANWLCAGVAFASLPLFVSLAKVRVPRISGQVFYAFYPAHLAAVYLVIGVIQ